MAFQFLFGTATLRFLADDKQLRAGTARAARTAQVQSKKIQQSLNKNIGRELRAVGAQAGALGGRFAALGAAIATPVGIAAVGILGLGFALKSVVSEAAGFEAAFAEVRTLFDESKVATAEIREELLKLPPILGSAEELTKALYQAISAGVEPAAAIELVGTAATLAKAGITSTFKAVDILTTVINAYGFAATEAARVSDVLFKTVELGKTTIDALASSLGVVIPFAAQLGISIEDLTAAVATLTKGGLDTRVAITALRGTFIGFIKNADEFRDIGIDIFKIIADPAQGLVGAFRALKDATGGNIEAISKLIPDSRALTAVLALGGVQFEEFVRIQALVKDSLGATATAFKKEAETFRLQSEALGNAFGGLKIQLGTVFLPTLTSVAEGLTNFIVNLKDAKSALRDFLNTNFLTPKVREFLRTDFGGPVVESFAKAVIAADPIAFVAGKIAGLFRKSKEEIDEMNMSIQSQAALVEELAEREDELNTKALDLENERLARNKKRLDEERKRRQALNDAILRGERGANLKLLEFERELTGTEKFEEEKRLGLTRMINDERLKLAVQRLDLLKVLGRVSLADEVAILNQLLAAENVTFDQRVALRNRLANVDRQRRDEEKQRQQEKESAGIRLLRAAQRVAEAEGRTIVTTTDVLKANFEEQIQATKDVLGGFETLRTGLETKEIPGLIAAIQRVSGAVSLEQQLAKVGGEFEALASLAVPDFAVIQAGTQGIVTAYEESLTSTLDLVDNFRRKVTEKFQEANVAIRRGVVKVVKDGIARELEFDLNRGVTIPTGPLG